ncbi:MAG: 50S ribosomal protein L24 [Candidatus Nanohaloarchaea archaeon]
MSKQWSPEWKSSKNPSKQRKYRENPPHHQRKKFLNARLAEDLQDKVGTGSIPVREGDRVEIMRGDFRGSAGEVEDIDTEEKKIYVEGVDRETVSGSETAVPVRPSNLEIQALELEDERRLEKYEVSEEDREDIRVEETEEPEEEEPETREEDVEEAGESGDEVDYEEIVSGTVDEVKQQVKEEDLDPGKVLETEEQNKNRSTLTSWLEKRVEDDE